MSTPEANEPGEDAVAPTSLDEMSWIDVAAHMARDTRLIVPVGALEQHGPHLPLGANILITRRIAATLAREFDVLRAPTFNYGVNVPTERAYAGTASIARKTLHRAFNELLHSWEAHGVTEFIVLTGHRHEPHLEALATLVTARARVRVVHLWDVPIDDLLDLQSGAEHGGEAETSMMLFLYPELVRMDRVRDFPMTAAQVRKYLRGRLPVPPPGGAGVVGFPSAASAEKGERIFQRMLQAIRDAVFLQSHDADSDTM